MAARGTAVVPTLVNVENFPGFAAAGESKFPAYASTMRRLYAQSGAVVRAAFEAGVPVFAGTDAGGGIEHGVIADEVRALHAAGLPAEAALAAGVVGGPRRGSGCRASRRARRPTSSSTTPTRAPTSTRCSDRSGWCCADGSSDNRWRAPGRLRSCCCGCRPCSCGPCVTTRPTPRSRATGCWCAPATSGGPRPAGSPGCRWASGSSATSSASSARRWTRWARRRCTSRRCCRASPTRRPAAGPSTARTSSACRTGAATTSCSGPRTRRCSRSW